MWPSRLYYARTNKFTDRQMARQADAQTLHKLNFFQKKIHLKYIKIISKWVSHQMTNYKKKSRIMKDEKIRSKWKDFINDPKYKQYFISYEEQWYDKLEKIKKVTLT